MSTEVNFKLWDRVYYRLHYYSFDEFLKNLCNDEYDQIITTEKANMILNRFQEFKKKKITDIFLQETDLDVLRVAR